MSVWSVPTPLPSSLYIFTEPVWKQKTCEVVVSKEQPFTLRSLPSLCLVTLLTAVVNVLAEKSHERICEYDAEPPLGTMTWANGFVEQSHAIASREADFVHDG